MYVQCPCSVDRIQSTILLQKQSNNTNTTTITIILTGAVAVFYLPHNYILLFGTV